MDKVTESAEKDGEAGKRKERKVSEQEEIQK